MRGLISAFIVACALGLPALAGAGTAPGAATPGCADSGMAALRGKTPTIHLAQSNCRGQCSSRRGYCMSTCRDSQCRAICNDLYQSCLSSCR